ncbi:MAG: TldD/PmbA family protein [Hyphomicrobiales bacterium]|nr:TldD/PmbA family protein [Rickettsiales bacterium]MCP5362334.1 TldD/PmbA family protein [Hyphomicrobiales bacterium]
MTEHQNALSALHHVIDRMRQAGADASDALLIASRDTNVRIRLGKPETLEQAESQDIGVRAMIADTKGYRQAVASTSDLSESGLNELAERVVAMAKAAPADPYAGLAPQEQLAQSVPELDLLDPTELPIAKLQEMAGEAEEAALAVKGITNSDGAEASQGVHTVALATSHGFAKEYSSTGTSVSVSVIAGEGDAMQTDYEYAVAVHTADLQSPAAIGRAGGERTAGKLSPKRAKTGKVPVVYESRVARGLLHSLVGAINGAAVARGTSFLKDAMGKDVFGKGITIVDDPFRPRGLGSHPFDAEGVQGERLEIIRDGVLTSWLLDVRSANQLGLKTTGHASRGLSSMPGPGSTNFYLEAGEQTPEALMADIKSGLYVTDVFGMGVNPVTGDYSQGAAGFWIENGMLTHPVHELTIAGNLKTMFKALTPANDLAFLYATNAPTVRIDGMTIAGE